MIKIPPRYIPTPVSVKYARTVPSELKDFFGSLYGLAWQSKYTFTPELNVDELLDLFGISGRTFQVYTQALEGLSWLRSETHRNGCVRYHFPERFPIPSEKVTIDSLVAKARRKALNAESCALSHKAQKSAYTQNPAFSGDDDEDDLQNPFNLDSSSSSSEDKTQNPAFSEKLILLRAAGVIAAQSVMDNQAIQADDVLAEIAYCYDSTNHVRKPDRIIGSNLLAGHRPSAIYYAEYARFIPATILEAAGLLKREEFDPEPTDDIQTQPEANASEVSEPSGHPAGVLVSDPLPNGQSLDWCWDLITRELQAQMPRSTFNHYIASSELVGYRAQDSTAIIQAQSTLAAEWLGGRMTRTLERLMTGIVNARIEVQFIAPQTS